MTEQAISARALQDQAAAYKERYHTVITEIVVPGLRAAGAESYADALVRFHYSAAYPLGDEPKAMKLHEKIRATAADFTETCLPQFPLILRSAYNLKTSLDGTPLDKDQKAQVSAAHFVVSNWLIRSGFANDYNTLQRNAAAYREQFDPEPVAGSREAAAARITDGSQISVLANEQA